MLRRRPIALILASLALFGAPHETWSQPQPAGAPSGTDPADVAFRRGNTLYKEKRYPEAKAAFEEAFRLKKAHDIASNLAYAEIKLGLHRDAAEHLAFAVKNWPPTGKSENRESAVHWLGVEKAAVTTLKVSVNVDGATVLVDGKAVGTSPLAGDIFVEPGARTVEAKLSGYQAARQSVEAAKGAEQAVTLKLEAAAPPPTGTAIAPPPTGAPSSPKPPGGPPLALVIVGGVLAAGGVAAGAGLTVAANGKRADVEQLHTKLAPGGRSTCYGSSPSTDCKTMLDAGRSRDALSKGAVAGFVFGGVFAAATVGMGVWRASTPKDEKASTVRVAPVMGSNEGGITVIGVW